MKKIIFSFITCLFIIFVFSKNVFAQDTDETNKRYEYGSYEYVINPDGKTVTIIGYDSYDPEIDIPSSMDGLKVTEIGADAFSWNAEIYTSLKIPYGITKIDQFAFSGLSKIKKLIIPASVESIEYGAFMNCTGLTDILIPASVKKMEGGVFAYCNGIKTIVVDPDNAYFDSRENSNSVIRKSDNCLLCGCNTSKIPQGVKTIGKNAFEGMKKLTDVTIPDSVTKICEGAFYYSSLKNVKMSNSVTYIGKDAFSYTNINNILLPRILKEIGSGAFWGCSKLEKITLPSSLVAIGELAFYDCTQLKSIFIPASVTKIGGGITAGCKMLTTIKVSSSNKMYDSRKNCNAIIEKKSNTLISGCEKSVIVNGVTTIGNDAFSGVGLTAVSIPNTVKIIGESSFSGCKIKEVIIPSNVIEVKERAFACCTNLKKIVVKNYNLKIGKLAFDDGMVVRPGIRFYCYNGSTTEKYAADVFQSSCIFLLDPKHPVNLTDGMAKTKITGVYNKKYTGKMIEQPNMTITVCGRKLVNNRDYTVKYSKNKNAGTAKIVITGKGNYKGSITKNFKIKLMAGSTYKVGNLKYKITKLAINGKGTAALVGTVYKRSSKKFISLVVPDNVIIGGVRFAVNSIGDNAFSGYKNLKKVSIGANVMSLGKNAFKSCGSLQSVLIGKNVRLISDYVFADCRKLAKMTIKTSYLTKNSVRIGAFRAIYKKITIKVPANKLGTYKKVLYKRGVPGSARITTK